MISRILDRSLQIVLVLRRISITEKLGIDRVEYPHRTDSLDKESGINPGSVSRKNLFRSSQMNSSILVQMLISSSREPFGLSYYLLEI